MGGQSGAARAYSTVRGGVVFLVARDATAAEEAYAPGWDATKPHALYSGTKSFWGVLAVAAQDDGLLALDEPVAETIVAWRNDARKRAITLRMLLTLSAGFGFGGLGNAVPTFEAALAIEPKNEPGTTFTYGGIPLQIFGAVLARKLAGRNQTPHGYLHERLLDPLGVRVASWRTLRDGSRPLPTGAFLSAPDWMRFGAFLLAQGSCGSQTLVRPESLAHCFEPSAANPRYALGFWLVPERNAAYASGAGGQGLYVLPKQRTLAVRFSSGVSFRHETLVRRLAEDADSVDDAR